MNNRKDQQQRRKGGKERKEPRQQDIVRVHGLIDRKARARDRAALKAVFRRGRDEAANLREYIQLLRGGE